MAGHPTPGRGARGAGRGKGRPLAGGRLAAIRARRAGNGRRPPRVAARRAGRRPPWVRRQHARGAQRAHRVRADVPARLHRPVQGHGRRARAVQLLRPGLAPVLQEDRPAHPAIGQQEHHLGAGRDCAEARRAARPGRRGPSLPLRVPDVRRPAPGPHHPAASADHDLGDPLGRDHGHLHRSRQQLRAHGGLAGLGPVRARPADGGGAGQDVRLQQRGHPAHRPGAGQGHREEPRRLRGRVSLQAAGDRAVLLEAHPHRASRRGRRAVPDGARPRARGPSVPERRRVEGPPPAARRLGRRIHAAAGGDDRGDWLASPLWLSMVGAARRGGHAVPGVHDVGLRGAAPHRGAGARAGRGLHGLEHLRQAGTLVAPAPRSRDGGDPGSGLPGREAR